MIIKGQKQANWCGPACVQEVLRRKGIKIGQKKLARLLETNEDGTTHENMVWALEAYGLDVLAEEDCCLDKLNAAINDGAIVIVDWMTGQNFEEDGHYSILEHADEYYVYLNNPEGIGYYGMFDRDRWEEVWFDIEADFSASYRWALVIA
jgi:ABC-type bacteriocin/lantibiotic exporter with double-glycine peptidase domain